MERARIGYAREMARKLLRKNGITKPWVPLDKVVEGEGLIYLEVDNFPDTIDALIVKRGKEIYAAVNKNHHIHRQRFSLAHELGHHLLRHSLH